MLKKLYLIVLFSLVASGHAWAGLTINPSRAEVTLPPGEVFVGTYTVRNDYELPTKINVESKDWFILSENEGIHSRDWLSVSTTSLYLKPGESSDVHYQVRVTTNAQGVLVGMVSFIPQFEEQPGISFLVSVAVFATVAGTEKRQWEIGEVKLYKMNDVFNVLTSVVNNGNVHLRPAGYVDIVYKKKNLMRLNIREGRPVYPRSDRTVLAADSQPTILKKGKYKATIVVQCDGEEKQKEIGFRVTKHGEIILK